MWWRWARRWNRFQERTARKLLLEAFRGLTPVDIFAHYNVFSPGTSRSLAFPAPVQRSYTPLYSLVVPAGRVRVLFVVFFVPFSSCQFLQES